MTLSTPVERRRRFARRALLSITTILCSGLAAPAFAQLAAPAPMRQSIDSNGVDLFTGTMNVDAPGMSMGQGEQGLSYHKLNRGSGWTDNITATLDQQGSTVTVSLGGTTDQFTASGTTYAATQGNGATLTFNGSVYAYTRADGTVVHFAANRGSPAPYYAGLGRAIDIVRPSGTKLAYAYDSLYYCSRSKPGANGDICTAHAYAYRPSTITSSYGYQLTFSYNAIAGYDSNDPNDGPDFATWSTSTGISETNTSSSGTSLTSSSSSGNGIVSIADQAGRVTSYRMDASGTMIQGITKPGSASEDVTVSYSNGRVSSVATPAGTWNYSSYDLDGTHTVTVTDPASQQTIYSFDIASQRMTSMIDALHHSTDWSYDASGRVTRVTGPEGDQNGGYIAYVYDDRGNVKQVRQVAKSGSGLADIVTSAAYTATCANTLTCNDPTSTTDANGNETDYTYDPTHGGVVRVTAPAPTANGVRPQVRYDYASFTDALGGTVYRQTRASTCQSQAGVDVAAPAGTHAGCEGTSDEAVTTTSYGSVSANNLLPVSTSAGAGDGSLTATTAMSYDAVGNMTSVDGPLPGADDTTRMFYDAARQRTEMVSPDPDGSGPLKNRAVSYGYTLHGLVATTSVGTANADGSGFVSLQQATTTYDAADRKVLDTVTAGGTTYAVTQYSYDPANRTMCAAMRMNPDKWNQLPSDACTLGVQGTEGQDRISKVQYDEVGRPKATISALGTPDQATDASVAYTADGRTQTATDANGNTTTYAYDGFDRLLTTTYPLTAKGSGSSNTADYEQIGNGNQPGYDPNGNVVLRRTRAGQVFGYSYDALNRLTVKTVPSGMRNVYYGYDLLGRPTGARFDGTNGTDAVLASYDALGRAQSSTTSMGKYSRILSYGYDLAGRRLRVQHPDGQAFSYSYDVLGEPVRTFQGEQGGTQLNLKAFDDLGQLTSNFAGTVTYGYDAVSRLNRQKILDLSNGPNGVNTTLAYNHASQIGSLTRSNDAYAFTGATNVNRRYTTNGLNHYTGVELATLTYDANGNLTSDGTTSYAYDAENRLVSASNGVTLTYDPIGRLWRTAGGSTGTTQFLYDGDQLAMEYDGSGNVLRRYVHGVGVDNPEVWYEGSGLGSPHYLFPDERGSISAIWTGTTSVNAYDEYGNPKPSNQGRFGYTGQAWLPDLGLWYYKARIYSPVLGRFMQTDPIGYGDGLSWHNYAGNDPVNRTDPSGTFHTGSLIPGVDGGSSCYGNCGGSGTSGSGAGAGSGSGGAVSGGGSGASGPVGTAIGGPQNGGLVRPSGATSTTAGYALGNDGNYHYFDFSVPSSSPLTTFSSPQDDASNDIIVTARSKINNLVLGQSLGPIATRIDNTVDDYFDSLFTIGEACCFTSGTLVSTPSGLKPIESLRVSDLVMSRNPKTGETVAKPIVGITPAHERRIWSVTVSYKEEGRWRDERYETTEDHPWRTVDGRWATTASLKQGQMLVRENGMAIVAMVQDTNVAKLTYNLTIADFHTYFVGKARSWVHNSCPRIVSGYDSRVRERAVQDPVSHGFPASYDSAILSTPPIRYPNNYTMYQLPGFLNGHSGNFEIGVNGNNIVDHRFFRRD